jgi:glycosyltransferase 2 family protein
MKHQALILIGIGIGILVGMVFYIGPGKIEDAIKLADPWYLALALILQFVVYGLWTWRWSINIKSVGLSVKKLHVFPMLMVGLAVNNITPSARGGGEPIRGYILSKYTASSFEKSFATVIADRALDTIPFIVLAVITIVGAASYLNLPRYGLYSIVIAVVVLVAGFLVLLYMSFNLEFGRKVSLWIAGIIQRFSKREHSQLEEKALKAIHGFQNSMRTMGKDKNVLIYGLSLSFLIWFLEILRVYIIFAAFNVDVSLLVIAEVFIISTLIGLIPLLPGGLGAVDGLMIILFSAAGVPPSISAAATIVERLISFWITSIIGLALLPYFGSSVVERIFRKD